MSLNSQRVPAKSGAPKRLVIFLHGYGSNGADLIALAPYFAQIDPDADFLSPDAPSANPFNPGGFQWFPIPFIDGSSVDEMAREFAKAKTTLNQYIKEELSIRGLGAKDLVLIGFSQGTMMALETGLRSEEALAGIIGFSGRIVFPDALAEDIRSKPPVLLVHGDIDDVVPVNDSIEANKFLKDHGIKTTLHISPNAPHTIAPDGLDAALKFYQKEILS